MPTELAPAYLDRLPAYSSGPLGVLDIAARAETVVRDPGGNTIPSSVKGTAGVWVSNATGGPQVVTWAVAKGCPEEGTFHNATLTVPDGWAGFMAYRLGPRWVGSTLVVAGAVEFCLVAWREGADAWS